MIVPLTLEIQNTWTDITSQILDVFSNEDNLEIYIEVVKSTEFEIIIDETGIAVIDESYNQKGIRLDRFLNKIDIQLNKDFKYYGRAYREVADIKFKHKIGKSSVGLSDSAGRENVFGIFGEQWATDIKNDIIAQFSYGKSNRDLKNEIVVGSGTVSIQDANLLTASTGIDIDGSAEIESLSSIRYRPAHTAISNFTAMFTNPSADNSHQWIGIADGVNGFAIGFFNGVFAIMRMKDGVHTHTFEADLNGNIPLKNIDFTKLNVFRISFGYLGIAPAIFEVMEEGSNKYKTIHSIQLHNRISETHIRLPYLPIKMSVMNTGNNTDCQIRSGSWQGGVMGLCQECGNRPFHYPITPGPAIKTGIGTTPTPIAAFRSKTTFQGFLNKIRVQLQLFDHIAFNGEGLVTLQLIGGATINGVEGTDYNFTDIDTQNSVMEVSTDLTGFTGGRVGLTLYSFPTTSGSKLNYNTADIDAEALGLFLEPGNTNIIAASVSANTVDIAWANNWTELF